MHRSRIAQSTAQRAVVFHAPHSELLQLQRNSPYKGDARSRAEWLQRYYRCGAALDLRFRSEQLQDCYEISERWVDTCFEMGDSDEVLVQLMAMAEQDEELATLIVQYEGQGTFTRWSEVARVGGHQLNLVF
jgi:hypothetical protein